MNSFNHYAFGSIAEWLYRYVCGINPVEEAPGFRRALIRPMPHIRLEHACAELMTAAGRYASGWQIAGDTITVDITVPCNATARICLPDAEASVSVRDRQVVFTCADTCETAELPSFVQSDLSLVVSCRPGSFDVYFRCHDKPEYLCTFSAEAFQDSNQDTVFADSYVHLWATGPVTVTQVRAYLDNGVSMADFRPIKYENGDVLLEQGKVYLTASVRLQEGNFQAILSWVPGTAEFEMTGALFYDCGDGKWRGYLAPVILYHRENRQWYVWVSSFAHKHILAHGVLDGDPRFGVNVADVQLMEPAADTSDICAFAGFRGDEDPDLFYDAAKNRWMLAICRVDPKTNRYGYVFFESNNPFDGYQYIGRGYDGEETGGSFVKIGGEQYLVCGNDFHATSEYRIYSRRGMETAVFRYPDGGFRGWGTVLPIRAGSRTRYYWLTFDRHNGSLYNWSYGNLYCFELYL